MSSPSRNKGRFCLGCKEIRPNIAFESRNHLCDDCEEEKELEKARLEKLSNFANNEIPDEEKEYEDNESENVNSIKKSLKRQSFRRGSIREHNITPGKWIVEMTLSGIRLRYVFGDLGVAKRALEVLRKIKEFEYAKRRLVHWDTEGRLNNLQSISLNSFLLLQQKGLSAEQREPLIDMYNEVNETITNKKFKGRYLGPQTYQCIKSKNSYSVDSDSSNWRYKLKKLGYLKKEKKCLEESHSEMKLE